MFHNKKSFLRLYFGPTYNPLKAKRDDWSALLVVLYRVPDPKGGGGDSFLRGGGPS